MKKSKELAALKREWYAKLKAEGFKDIEYFDKKTMEPLELMARDGKSFPLVDGQFASKTATKAYEQTLSYYSYAAAYLPGIPYDTIERVVWELHIDGKSIRRIAKIVNVWPPAIMLIIKRHRTKMLEEMA